MRWTSYSGIDILPPTCPKTTDHGQPFKNCERKQTSSVFRLITPGYFAVRIERQLTQHSIYFSLDLSALSCSYNHSYRHTLTYFYLLICFTFTTVFQSVAQAGLKLTCRPHFMAIYLLQFCSALLPLLILIFSPGVLI